MKKSKKVHFMGISGSGMGGVAKLARSMGYEVTGCDLESSGHNMSHLEDVDLLVISPAVLYQNKAEPEFLQAKKKKIVMTWQEFLGSILLKEKKIIAITGTHGKSTTTAMAGKLLEDANFDPIVVVGAKVPGWRGSVRIGKGDWAVIEADEFNDNFLHYSPEIIILNNIEFDHPDYFRDETQVKKSFEKFVSKLKNKNNLITQKDSLNKKFNLKVMGKHNQQNANMVFVLGKKLGISTKNIIKSLESFEGIGRRMELLGKTKSEILIFDDYAHHPTAIKTTLKGLREKYPSTKMLAIIEPHGYKRTKALLRRYKGVFDSVDKVIIGPIFKARDKIDKSITPQKVAKVCGHLDAVGFESFRKLFDYCKLVIGEYSVAVIMGAGKSNLWAKRLLKIMKLKTFKDLTTFNVGGSIKHFIEVKNEKEVKKAVDFAKNRNLPIFVIGEGSDILPSDSDYGGVVIKYVGNKTQVTSHQSLVTLTAEAGVVWDDLVKFAVKNNLQGVECLSGIPGTVGAAPIQNIGAYGQELSDVFVELRAYDFKKEKFIKLSKKECKFGYRESIFKKPKNWQRFIITKITLKLKKYKDKDLDLQTIREEILRVRSEKLEDPKKVPNAGSFFKNPIISKEKKEELEIKYPDIKIFPLNNKFKVFGGFLIEKAGWKGKSLGRVKVSGKHALILTNPAGKGTTKEILNLAEAIQKDVYKKFKINLEPEVHFINF